MSRPQPRARVTRNDVAAAAGVSPALVSFVLNNYKHVRPQTRARVQQAIEELGYQPNLAARSLRTRRTNQIAFLLADLANSFWSEVAAAIEEQARAAGFSLLMISLGNQPETAVDVLRRFQVDGVIGAALTEPLIKRLREEEIPAVTVLRGDGPTDLPSVDTDWQTGMRLVLEHLRGLGHRSVALLHGPTEPGFDWRLRWYRTECRRLGLEGAGRVVEGDWRIEGGRRAMLAILDRWPELTAVVGGNDAMALGALQACRERGVRVPHELSLTGWDNQVLAQVAEPALTTVNFPRNEAGAASFRLLFDLVERGFHGSVIIPPELIVRQSTGPAPARG
jgi:DNA-binding LacI/PurR family transcriptional regulator